ncbi:MAG: hypothetical protein AB7G36_18700 [Candidatus Nanopelagicales bacterium]
MTSHARWDIDPAPVAGIDPSGPDWYRVTDTEGRVPVLSVRVSEAGDGRLVLTGLVIGDGAHEVDANMLRAIQPAAIVRTIAWRHYGAPPPRSVGDIGPTGLARFEGVAQAINAIATDAEPTGEESRRGRRGPSRIQLERFAEEYQSRYRVSRYDAMTATARKLRISRATAHRWASRCRELGLLSAQEARTDD